MYDMRAKLIDAVIATSACEHNMQKDLITIPSGRGNTFGIIIDLGVYTRVKVIYIQDAK